MHLSHNLPSLSYIYLLTIYISHLYHIRMKLSKFCENLLKRIVQILIYHLLILIWCPLCKSWNVKLGEQIKTKISRWDSRWIWNCHIGPEHWFFMYNYITKNYSLMIGNYALHIFARFQIRIRIRSDPVFFARIRFPYPDPVSLKAKVLKNYDWRP